MHVKWGYGTSIINDRRKQLNTCDFNYGLYYACSGGHKEIALLMIENGCSPEGSRLAPLRANNFNGGMLVLADIKKSPY